MPPASLSDRLLDGSDRLERPEADGPTPGRAGTTQTALSGLDEQALVAAQACRAVDLGALSRPEVAVRHGATVADLVENVFRLRHLAGLDAPPALRQKLLLAAVPDPRPLLLVLALQAEQLRASLAGAQPAAPIGNRPEPARLGRETLELHAPLAHRLGLAALKEELEDAAFRATDRVTYQRLDAELAARPGASTAATAALVARLVKTLSVAGLHPTVNGRRKSLWSLQRKLAAGRHPEDIYDLVGLRVICNGVEECYLALAALHATWEPVPGRLKDFIVAPTPNGYRSLHSTVQIDGQPVEVQIRTADMHLQAEWGIAAHWLYKQGFRSATSSPSPPRAPAHAVEALERLQAETLAGEVYAVTPQGRVIQLPEGATPVDFAYSIHTDLGHRCKAARVDGKLHRLSAPLPGVATVEIISGPRAGPSREWLTSVRTGRARTKIRAWFRAGEVREQRRLGGERLRRALLAEGVHPESEIVARALATAAVELGLSSADELTVALGNGALPAGRVARLVARAVGMASAAGVAGPPRAQPRPAGSPPGRRRALDGEVAVVVDGQLDVGARVARCCHPLPGQRVVGFVSSGRGLIVHQAGCPELALLPGGAARLVAVRWPEAEGQRVRAELAVEVEREGGSGAARARSKAAPGTADRRGDTARLLQEAVAAGHGEVVDCEASAGRAGRSHFRLVVTVDGVEQFRQVRERLEIVPGVVSVRG